MKRFGPVIAAMLLLASIAGANAVKRWQNGDVITAADLTAAFNHIHNTMVGNGHNTITNGDVLATASLSPGKFNAGSAIWPIGYASFTNTASCSAATHGTCTLDFAKGLTISHRPFAGEYQVNFYPVRTNLKFHIVLSNSTLPLSCIYLPTASVSSFQVSCYSTVTSAATDAPFNVLVFDYT